MKNRFFLLMTLCLFFSCVSSDKYKELVQVKDYLEAENERLTNSGNDNRDLRLKFKQDQMELSKTQAELAELQRSFGSLNRNYQDLAKRYNALVDGNRQISDGGATDKQYWEEELAKKQLELEDTQRQLRTLRYTLVQKDKRVQELLKMLRAKEGN